MPVDGSDKPVAFTQDAAQRISRVVRAYEKNPPRDDDPNYPPIATSPNNWQFIRVTGVVTGGDAGCTGDDEDDSLSSSVYYPGVIAIQNVDTEAWEDTSYLVWLRPVPGQIVKTNDYILGKQATTNGCILGESRPLFNAFAGGGGGCTGLIPVITGLCIAQDNKTSATVVGNATITLDNKNITHDVSGGNATLTLPAIAGVTGHEFTVTKDDTSNTSTIVTSDATTIDGASSLILTLDNPYITLFKEGANWRTRARASEQIQISKLFDVWADGGNVGTAETDLHTYTLQANRFATNGTKVIARYFGTWVYDSVYRKQLRFYFGSTALFDTSRIVVPVNPAWEITATLIQSDTTKLRYFISINMDGCFIPPVTGELTGQDFTIGNVIKITGLSESTSNDVVLSFASGEWKR